MSFAGGGASVVSSMPSSPGDVTPPEVLAAVGYRAAPGSVGGGGGRAQPVTTPAFSVVSTPVTTAPPTPAFGATKDAPSATPPAFVAAVQALSTPHTRGDLNASMVSSLRERAALARLVVSTPESALPAEPASVTPHASTPAASGVNWSEVSTPDDSDFD